jgi:FkbM family methyltransferase
VFGGEGRTGVSSSAPGRYLAVIPSERWKELSMSWVAKTVVSGLRRRGFAIQRHPGSRLQTVLAHQRVDLVFDVGAARGGFAQDLRKFGYTGRVVSFEPMSAAYADLAAASTGHEQWTTVNSALGETAGRQAINIASNSDSSSLLAMEPGHLSAAPEVDYVGQEEIEVARLDDIAPAYLQEGSRPFLKIDTQGFEKQVLAGGPTTLARCVVLQLELSFVPLYAGGMLVDEAISYAYDAGFEMVAIAHGFTSPTGMMLQADGVFVRKS